jgi:hypothetical protein
MKPARAARKRRAVLTAAWLEIASAIGELFVDCLPEQQMASGVSDGRITSSYGSIFRTRRPTRNDK